MATAKIQLPRARAQSAGRFGVYGGRYVPETLMAALEELERHYDKGQTRPQVSAPSGRTPAHLRRPSHAFVFRAAG